MNLFRFVDQYGSYTFEEIPFCEVDNAIFASLSYVNLDGLVSKYYFSKKTIHDVGEEYFKTRYSKKNKNPLLSIKQAIKLFRYLKDTKRYGNLFLYNYVYECGEEQQFSAVTIEINPKLVYVSFEGTDHLISGWKEDFMMSYQFPVLSQKKAIQYINSRFLFQRKEIILGGHSKGGNLAMVAGMYANFIIRNKIIQVYNNDGPGLLLEQITSKNYQYVQDKLIYIVPSHSVVGLILRHTEDITVVRSARKNVFSHDIFSWIVKEKKFERDELSLFSKRFDEGLVHWLTQYDLMVREQFVLSLFEVFERANVTSLIDIMENKRLILHLITEMKELDDATKKILKDLIFYLVRCFKDVKFEELKLLFEKNNA